MKHITKNKKSEYPTEAVKIAQLAEISEETISNNDTFPISNLEGTKKIPLHRIKAINKHYSIKAQEVVASSVEIAEEDILLNDVILLEGLSEELTEDIIVNIPSVGVPVGKKLLFFNKNDSKTPFGYVIKQSERVLARLTHPRQKEEIFFIEEWQSYNYRSQLGLIGLDVSLVGDPTAILAQRDYLLPYTGGTYNQKDYPELCTIKRLAPDWKFDDEAKTFIMPDYLNYFIRQGAANAQGTKKIDTMRQIKASGPFITKGKNFTGSLFLNKSWNTDISASGRSDSWGSDLFFDSAKGIAGQEGKASPNVGAETAPMHIITTFYVIAK